MTSDSQIRFRIDRLQEIRERLGISQRELARRCGFSLAQIYRYESGTTEPNAETLGIIARELNVTSDYLLGLSDSAHGYSAGDLRPDERRVLDAFKIGDGTTMIKLMAERIREIENADG